MPVCMTGGLKIESYVEITLFKTTRERVSTDPVIKLKYYMISCLPRTKLQIYDPVHTKLFNFLKSSCSQVLT